MIVCVVSDLQDIGAETVIKKLEMQFPRQNILDVLH